mgnify:CR=1 FL=1
MTANERRLTARRSPSTDRHAHGSRRAAVLVVALMCLLLAGVFAVSLVQHALRQRDQVLRDEWQMQAYWLADSAIDRAAQRVSVDQDYSGEVWRPASAGPAGEGDKLIGQVEIRVTREPAVDGVLRTRVLVIADVPDDPVDRARVRRETVLEFRSETE